MNGKQLNNDITLNASDVGASTPAQVNEAKTMATNAQNTANSAVTKANTAQTTANNANNNANGRVPNTRKVNGKQLNNDITLNASDVGALTQKDADNRYVKSKKTLVRIDNISDYIETGMETALTHDIRGKIIYIKWSKYFDYTMGIIPDDNVNISFNTRQDVYAILFTKNQGKTLCVNRNSVERIVGVFIYD